MRPLEPSFKRLHQDSHHLAAQVRRPTPALILSPTSCCESSPPASSPCPGGGSRGGARAQASATQTERCFTVTVIQGSSVVLTCLRWYLSQPRVMKSDMHLLSVDTVKDSEQWNHSDMYDSLTYLGVGPIALRIHRLDPSAAFGLYKRLRAELEILSVSNNHGVVWRTNFWSMGNHLKYPIQGLGSYG